MLSNFCLSEDDPRKCALNFKIFRSALSVYSQVFDPLFSTFCQRPAHVSCPTDLSKYAFELLFTAFVLLPVVIVSFRTCRLTRAPVKSVECDEPEYHV